MKIGLIGYGKMGKAIERIALERGHTIVFRSSSQQTLADCPIKDAEVAIEFTQPELAPKHIHFCLENKLPVVVGTTAWQAHLPEIISKTENEKGALLYASNFSVGVNILFEVNNLLAKLMSSQNEYTAEIEEIHHVQKLDAPSGTAVSIANGIIENHERYAQFVSETGVKPTSKNNELPILALREPNVPGTHAIKYVSEIDTIELSHTAHSRDGFALGAVLAAEFLYNKQGVFTMKDVLKF